MQDATFVYVIQKKDIIIQFLLDFQDLLILIISAQIVIEK
jgi:hypothetical protein